MYKKIFYWNAWFVRFHKKKNKTEHRIHHFIWKVDNMWNIRSDQIERFFLSSCILLAFGALFLFICVFFLFFFFNILYSICDAIGMMVFYSLSLEQLLQHLKTLSMAEMGPMPMGLLAPFTHLNSLNLSGNHLVNISLQILDPVTSLEVSQSCPMTLYFFHLLFHCI